jgi:hypothetical protein
LTPKLGLDLIPKPNPNGPIEPAHCTRSISSLTPDKYTLDVTDGISIA